MRQWERGRERVSVCLFVTFSHLSKYASPLFVVSVAHVTPMLWRSCRPLRPTASLARKRLISTAATSCARARVCVLRLRGPAAWQMAM
jgi:hypothetical protein